MKVLVVGRGGREHAVVQKLTRDGVAEIYAAPGNVGMTAAKLVPINETEVAALADFAAAKGIDLTIVGPESALVAGIVDEFNSRGLRIFGPTAAAAQLEGSKAFAKQLMAKHGIPTAAYAEFTEAEPALAYVREKGLPFVIKADGLAAGKGVVIPTSLAEAESTISSMLSGSAFGDSGKRIVIEEFLDGEEFSLMSFVAGDKFVPMPVARDYKRAFDGDAGLNTGGMGAHSPNPLIADADTAEAIATVVSPTVKALIAEGIPFTGVLYAGLIKTDDGVKVIEFNVRFGDPETEVVLPRLETPLVELIDNLITLPSVDEPNGVSKPTEISAEWSSKPAVGVVLATKGYPGDFEKGGVISGLEKLEEADVYHMGTALSDNGDLISNGGRVLFIAAKGETLADARAKVYQEIEKIEAPTLFHRKDIALNK